MDDNKVKIYNTPAKGEVYQPLIYCGNCKIHKKITIKKGMIASFEPCPNCGCKTLIVQTPKTEQ